MIQFLSVSKSNIMKDYHENQIIALLLAGLCLTFIYVLSMSLAARCVFYLLRELYESLWSLDAQQMFDAMPERENTLQQAAVSKNLLCARLLIKVHVSLLYWPNLATRQLIVDDIYHHDE